MDDALEEIDDVIENGSTCSSPVIDDLIARTKTLLLELEAFRNRLRALRLEGTVEIAHFRSTIQSELEMLQKLSLKPESDATNHVARSSNLPFLETVWSTAKKSKDLVSLQKRMYVDSGTKALSQGMRHLQLSGRREKSRDTKSGAIIIDAMTDDGRTWTKVSLVTNTRLLFDLAKQGWDSGASDEEIDGSIPLNSHTKAEDGNDDGDIPLLKSAKDLTGAAKMFRVRTKHPLVQLVLPRIQTGETPEVDEILDDCRACGATLFCGKELQPSSSLEDALEKMAPDPMSRFSDTLNIDCTILLALVSEFSHAKVSKEPWFYRALQRQVEIEDNENLLPSLLYPALGAHQLVCTKEAAHRMREIVETIGTPSEKARTAIMMGEDSSRTQEQLVEEIQEWSAYSVPTGWQLPIRVVDQNEDGCQSNLPVEAEKLTADMTAINKSVFKYGWASGRTTITSNRIVVKQIENGLDNLADLDDSVWPSLWLCPTARSLVGKEKRGAKKEGWKADVLPLPDPLHREQQRRNGLDVLTMRNGHEVEDLRPNGYPSEEVIAAKNASQR